MFPILTDFYSREKTIDLKSFLKTETLSLGIDPYQFEVSVDSLLNDKIFKIQRIALELLSEKNTFCFYCGESSKNIIPCFMHDGSGINLWLLSELRSSSIICDTCASFSGKQKINYRRRVADINEGNLAGLLKFEPEILLPTIEPVDLHFDFELTGLLKPKSIRALRTINLFSLNRDTLVNRRKRALEGIRDDAYNMKVYTNESGVYPLDNVFASIASGQFEQGKDTILKGKGKYNYFYRDSYSRDIPQKHKSRVFKSIRKTSPQSRVFSSFVGLKEFEFNNIRPFERKQKIRFAGKNSIILLGENGVGKSTLLEIIEKTLKPRAKINFKTYVSDEILSNKDFPFLMISYSSNSRLVKFSPDVTKVGRREGCNIIKIPEGRIAKSQIEGFQNWLIENAKKKKLIDWISRKLKLLLDFSNDYKFEVTESLSFWFNKIDSENGRKYLHDFSSGYRSLMVIFHIIVSKLYRDIDDDVFELNMALDSTVVLIDELELHLHPRLKMKVVGVLQELFPSVLFIISTHDPLILKSANEKTKVLLLEENEKQRTTIRDDLPSHQYLTTEQILTSPFFGLYSTSRSDKEDVWKNYNYALENGDKSSASKYRQQISVNPLFSTKKKNIVFFDRLTHFI